MSGTKKRGRSKRARRKRWLSRRFRRRLLRLGAATAVAFALAALGFGLWVGHRPPGDSSAVAVRWPATGSPKEGAERLADRGLIRHPRLFRFLLWATGPFIHIEPGPHLLRGGLSAGQIVRRLARLSSRPKARITVPEGFNVFQVAERLEGEGIASRAAFLDAARDTPRLIELGVLGSTAEGYLFPATYELYENSSAPAVVKTMVRETHRRLETLLKKYPARMKALEEELDWGPHDILTLASIVEREAAVAEEQPLIASVFFNRLRDARFRPAKMLQSDPTAGYGCLLTPLLESCEGYTGQITPRMLRDVSNTYNTYHHAGLPPGPIANPGEGAIEAVLTPADTDYLFFVASGGGRHTFSRTLSEHETAIGTKDRENGARDPGR